MIRQCQSIKKGMIFWNPADHSELWEVIDIGNYFLKDGQRTEVFNQRRNKWNCRRLGTKDHLELVCFEEVFDPDKWNFHKP